MDNADDLGMSSFNNLLGLDNISSSALVTSDNANNFTLVSYDGVVNNDKI